MRKSKYEGLQKNVRKLKLPKIEVWENMYKDKDYTIHLETNEFTCICPKTGLPDFAVIVIDYGPDRFCAELKSFKLYLHAFRDVGIFHEHLTNRILDDFVQATKPRWADIRAEFNLRGGIKTTIERDYNKL
ncbi:preQ(1) synthase [Candidatus Omnitrophota bacterium]